MYSRFTGNKPACGFREMVVSSTVLGWYLKNVFVSFSFGGIKFLKLYPITPFSVTNQASPIVTDPILQSGGSRLLHGSGV